MAAAAPPTPAAAAAASQRGGGLPCNLPHHLFVFPGEDILEVSVYKVCNTYTHSFFSAYFPGVHTTGIQNTTSSGLLRITWIQKFI